MTMLNWYNIKWNVLFPLAILFFIFTVLYGGPSGDPQPTWY